MMLLFHKYYIFLIFSVGFSKSSFKSPNMIKVSIKQNFRIHEAAFDVTMKDRHAKFVASYFRARI